MSTLRVVQVSFHADALRRRGAELLEAWPTLPQVARAVSDAGASVAVVQCAHVNEAVVVDDVIHHFTADDSSSRFLVGTLVAALEPDVVHVQGFGHALAMRALTRRLAGIPVLVQDHGSVVPTGLRRSAWKWGHARIAGVAFTAREQASPWREAGIVAPDVAVFEVLESSTEFAPTDRAAARAATGMQGDPSFLWTGHLDANKDPLALLDAFERALVHLPEARLYCCFMTAPLRAQVEQRIARSPSLASHVTLVGARPRGEMERWFGAADFFVQMSHREGSGYSIIEALACGATPLVTDIPSARAIVGDAGSLTPVGDAAAMAEAMVDWGSRDRAQLRRQARARFESALTFAHVGRQLVDAYQQLAGRSARAASMSHAMVGA